MRTLYPQHIPDELKALNQWTCWQDVNGRKMPKQASNPRYGSSSTKKHTWGSYDQALSTFEQHHELSGIGFFLHYIDKQTGEIVGDDSLVMLDLDNCLDKDGTPSALAKEAL